MALIQRIESLKKRHAEVDHFLHTEESRPSKNEPLIQKLKKEKLTLKDEITRLSTQEAAA